VVPRLSYTFHQDEGDSFDASSGRSCVVTLFIDTSLNVIEFHPTRLLRLESNLEFRGGEDVVLGQVQGREDLE
jgi:hypothetical protein